jgi:hypothetical protein
VERISSWRTSPKRKERRGESRSVEKFFAERTSPKREEHRGESLAVEERFSWRKPLRRENTAVERIMLVLLLTGLKMGPLFE